MQVAVGMNNRASIYRCDGYETGLVEEREYIGRHIPVIRGFTRWRAPWGRRAAVKEYPICGVCSGLRCSCTSI